MLAGGDAAASWTALGTQVRLVVGEAAALPAARLAVETVLCQVDAAASRFREDSELSRLVNASGEWREISPLLAELIGVALDAAAVTDGLLDPTVATVLGQLGYDRSFELVPAEGAPVRLGVTGVPGVGAIAFDRAGRRVRLDTGVRLDLGATAKGRASDLAAAAAFEATGYAVLVGLGGDIALAGAAPEAGWTVLISDSADPSSSASKEGQKVVLRTGGLATSSVTARRWRRGGSLFHHIVDPRTAVSAAGPWRTVSVAAGSCLAANVASTAAVIMGEQAPGWLSAREYPARLVGHDGSVLKVGGWP